MSARVGFSVAVHMKPDISMIDEALSTGDAHFREKATAKMAELRESARAMFVVSHGLDSIKEMCNEAMWLDHGKLMMRGEPADVVDAYIKFVKVKKSPSNWKTCSFQLLACVRVRARGFGDSVILVPQQDRERRPRPQLGTGRAAARRGMVDHRTSGNPQHS
jgi:ABC-type multidrug transport system ATPase subunit